ncbi:MAG: ATP phosphoribosyltransferase regulatory subunit [Thiothrix sp.]|nr:ATP phosphoribosyltransferase regulatory subunit [Thiothrix sp.]HPQ96828.1 ATP phosphoribosyltransferase regulatory subunit [Thiolinea sp.]
MSTSDYYWALPDGISEALPDEALRLEHLRRQLLDLYSCWGYQLVMPPLVEYMESLSTGLGSNLDVQTFKVTDQLNGRMLGIRADMTPQIARIDAHKLPHQPINRLCYIGSVLRTRAFHSNGSRAPLQVGAELFGHSGLDSDVEVISLLLNTLKHCQTPAITLSLGHVGIFRGLSEQAGLSAAQELEFHDMLVRKSLPEIDAWLAGSGLPAGLQALLQQLPRLQGSTSVLERARTLFTGATAGVHEALDYLTALCQRLVADFPDIRLHMDLTELSGYDYHTGIVYAVYVDGYGHELARGGRYDGVGRLFGQARPATGFSTDLRLLAAHAGDSAPVQERIFAPASADSALNALVSRLRSEGHCVVRELAGSHCHTAQCLSCTRAIIRQDGQWVVTAI